MVEQHPFKLLVPGSSPGGPTIFSFTSLFFMLNKACNSSVLFP